MSPEFDFNFRSDNNAGIAPEIMQALSAENGRKDDAYNRDTVTAQLDAIWSEVFEKQVHVVPVVSGTAANAIALSLMSPSHGVVFTHPQGHIVEDEVNAPGYLNPGLTFQTVPGAEGKIPAEALAKAIDLRAPFSVNKPRPALLSLAQCTEVGTVYSRSQLNNLNEIVKSSGLAFHMDGARFANALISLGCSPADISWRCGVNVLSLGAGKNGCLNVDALILFNEEDRQRWWYRVKQSGGLAPKLRFNSAQLLAYAKDNRWMRYAEQANKRATHLSDALMGFDFKTLYPVQANEVFLKLPAAVVGKLRAEGFAFQWRPQDGTARFVTAFDTNPAAVEALAFSIRRHYDTERK